MTKTKSPEIGYVKKLLISALMGDRGWVLITTDERRSRLLSNLSAESLRKRMAGAGEFLTRFSDDDLESFR